MDSDAITVLIMRKVKYLISANSIELSSKEKADLKTNQIGYLWLKVPDFGAPTEKQFRDAHAAYAKNKKGVHFYCGWGNGRTGTYVTGVEILEGVYPNSRPTRADYDRNFVESDTQRNALNSLWDSWKKNGVSALEETEAADEDEEADASV
ncbi:hypothetical protein BDW22DRAFT_1362739 [Trametopsis cervina]|nr:hypothetical protein BDW22DRAFT_1362739 [Trametopsis cervina]